MIAPGLLIGHTLATGLATLIAVSRELPGTPFGVATGRTAGFDATIGYGTALSAPWPVLLGLWALRRHPAARWIAAAMVVGQLSEPQTWRGETWRDPILAPVIAGNLIVPFSMCLVGSRNGSGTVGG